MRAYRVAFFASGVAVAVAAAVVACVTDEPSINIFSDGGNTESGAGALSLDGSPLAFSSACGTEASAKSIVLENHGSDPVTWSASLSKNPSPFSIDTGSGTVQPGASVKIAVSISAFDAGTSATATDKLTITTPAGDTAIDLTVTTTGPALVVTPTSLALGDTPYRGTSAPQPVTIKNVGTAPATVSLSAAAPFAASLTGSQTIAADASITAYVTASPLAEGGVSGSLSIQVDPGTTLCGSAPGNVALSANGVNGPMLITEGVRNVCVVTSDNSVYCWGNNGNGQIGNGTPANNTVNFGAPQQVKGLSGASIVSIGTGYQSECVTLAPHGFACWGHNVAGQSGQPPGGGLTTAAIYDGSVGPTNVELAQIAGGAGTTYARNAGGMLFCWGDNTGQRVYGVGGQFGIDPTTDVDDAGNGCTNIPAVCPYLQNIGTANDVAMNAARVCATVNAGVSCWPSIYAQDGTQYLDGDGGLTDGGSWGPSPILDPDGKPLRSKQLTMGAGHTCALQATGEVFCFGDNALGQLGDGTMVSSFNKAVRVKGLTDAVSVSSGTAFSCAVRANGSVACWGDNTHGQLANNSTAPSMVPTPASALTQPVSMLSGCSQGVCDFMCAVTQGAEVWCWGANTYLQLGQGTTGPAESHVPLRVQGF